MSATKRRSAKKKIIIGFIIVLATLLLLYGITLIIPFFEQKMTPEETEYIADFNFYPADYSEDIFDDTEYLALIQDGLILYDNNSNFATMVDKDNATQFEEGVDLLVDMVYAIIYGDVDGYNECFSEKYYENHSPKESFTMQKIYNGKLTYLSSEEVAEDGVTYTAYTYKISYYIHENNGTFRKDIGDKEAREQYIVVSEREGSMLIDDIQYISFYN